MARRAFGNSVDPGAQQENTKEFYRAQKKAIQIDQQKTMRAVYCHSYSRMFSVHIEANTL